MDDADNRMLLDINGDFTLDVSDAVTTFGFLLPGGPPPSRGTECLPIPGGHDSAGCQEEFT